MALRGGGEDFGEAGLDAVAGGGGLVAEGVGGEDGDVAGVGPAEEGQGFLELVLVEGVETAIVEEAGGEGGVALLFGGEGLGALEEGVGFGIAALVGDLEGEMDGGVGDVGVVFAEGFLLEGEGGAVGGFGGGGVVGEIGAGAAEHEVVELADVTGRAGAGAFALGLERLDGAAGDGGCTLAAGEDGDGVADGGEG